MSHEAWSGIDVQLKRRSDLIPNLVESVKGYASHERALFQRVAELRTAAQALPAEDVAARARAEGALALALGRVMALAENYPDLKASANFLDLQQQLSTLETEIQMARRYYNGAVRDFNTRIEQFPASLLSALCGWRPLDLFQVTEAEERGAPRIQGQELA
jgi:LemA protein